MLNIYCGRNAEEREDFLYSKIESDLAAVRAKAKDAERVLLVVPAQFTLKAEEMIFQRSSEEGFFDLHIMSGSRFRRRILEETGRLSGLPIDVLGRTMLLRKIVKGNKDSMQAFGKVSQDPEFLSIVGDFIAQIRQHDVSPDDLVPFCEGDTILARKLSDIERIYRAYEDMLSVGFFDEGSALKEVAEKARFSSWVTDSVIWYYGFYSFTPREMMFIGQLMEHAAELNVLLPMGLEGDGDFELFEPARLSVEALRNEAGKRGVVCNVEHFEADMPGRPQALALLDRELFADIPSAAPAANAGSIGGSPEGAGSIPTATPAAPPAVAASPGADPAGGAVSAASPGADPTAGAAPPAPPADPPAIELVSASNYYSLAETAACRIMQLVRERGFSYSDISVLTNDLTTHGDIIKGVFGLYDIPIFLDEKRSILHSPLARGVLHILDIVAKGFRRKDVTGLLKSGIVPGLVCEEASTGGEESADIEDFENYLIQCNITGRRFLSPFTLGGKIFEESELEVFEAIRQNIAGILVPFRDAMKSAPDLREKCRLLYNLLQDELNVPDTLSLMASALGESGMQEESEETAQLWKVLMDLLDQAVELLGDYEADVAEFRDIIASSLGDIRVGLLPQTEREVLVGSISRSLITDAKAVFIFGANDGILPSANPREGLLSDFEVESLAGQGLIVGKDNSLREKEEKLRIYEAFTRAREFLWVGYSNADLIGDPLKPSALIERIKDIFPDMEERGDLQRENDAALLIQGVPGAAYNLASALRDFSSGESAALDPVWKEVYNTLSETEGGSLEFIKRGLLFDGRKGILPKELTAALFKGRSVGEPKGDSKAAWRFSPSRLENFSSCPFKHFVNYGLRPKERRMLEVGGREIGDIYHACLMEVSSRLSRDMIAEGKDITSPDSPWMTITKDECAAMVAEIMQELKEGEFAHVLSIGKAEEYRMERMVAVGIESAWNLILHVRSGNIKRMYFEQAFADMAAAEDLPPIRFRVGGEEIRIEGKIDRLDILDTGKSDAVKVVDYKSGGKQFFVDLVRHGMDLQLMLYLEAGLRGLENAEPAGAFYYRIGDKDLPVGAEFWQRGELPEPLLFEMEKKYRMEGLFLDDEAVVESIDGDLDAGETSSVINLRRLKDSTYSSSQSMKPDDFDSFRADFIEKVEEICGRLLSGIIDANPAYFPDKFNACEYCEYRSICCFENSIEGFSTNYLR